MKTFLKRLSVFFIYNLVLFSYANAQTNMEWILPLMQNDFQKEARFEALGGADISLGSSSSSFATNPAGLIDISSTFATSFTNNINYKNPLQNTSFQDKSLNNNFQVGFAYKVGLDGDFKNSNYFAFALNISNQKDEVSPQYNQINSKSISNFFLSEAQEHAKLVKDKSMIGPEYLFFKNGLPRNERLAYEVGIIGFENNAYKNNVNSNQNTAKTLSQNYIVSKTTVNLGLAYSISDHVRIGFSYNYMKNNYSNYFKYKESTSDYNILWDRNSLNQYSKATSFSFGIIIIPTYKLRIGVNIASSQEYIINEEEKGFDLSYSTNGNNKTLKHSDLNNYFENLYFDKDIFGIVKNGNIGLGASYLFENNILFSFSHKFKFEKDYILYYDSRVFLDSHYKNTSFGLEKVYLESGTAFRVGLKTSNFSYNKWSIGLGQQFSFFSLDFVYSYENIPSVDYSFASPSTIKSPINWDNQNLGISLNVFLD